MGNNGVDLSVRSHVFAPWQVGQIGVEYAQNLQANSHKAVPFPVERINTYFAPVLPGQSVAVIAKSQNFKSGFMKWWEEDLADYLVKCGRGNESIIHVDTEHSLEELSLEQIAFRSSHSMADLSRGNVRDWRDVVRGASEISGVNIFRIANTLGEESGPELHLSNIFTGIKHLVNGDIVDRKVTPAAIFIDYLQALPIDPVVAKSSKNFEKQRRIQVREDVYRIKRMAQYFGCPVIVGVQAKQVLTGTLGPTMLIPGLYDGEETSSIAQRFGRVIGLWMPKNDFGLNDTLNHKGSSFAVKDNLLMVRVTKQQGGLPSGRWWDCGINYKDMNHIYDLNGRSAEWVYTQTRSEVSA